MDICPLNRGHLHSALQDACIVPEKASKTFFKESTAKIDSGSSKTGPNIPVKILMRLDKEDKNLIKS